LSGSPAYALLADPHSETQLRQALASLRNPSASASLEVNFKDASGAPVPVDVSCTVRSAGNGRFIGHVLVGARWANCSTLIANCTRPTKRSSALNNNCCTRKMASLGRLVAGVAHELNNPISFVLANAHVLDSYGKRLQQYLQAVHDGESQTRLHALRQQLRIDPLLSDLPSLIEGSMEGAQRTADIVSALKRFSAVDREALGEVDSMTSSSAPSTGSVVASRRICRCIGRPPTRRRCAAMPGNCCKC
jgi:two-component system sensor histidine kinase HupT/HoxJ